MKVIYVAGPFRGANSWEIHNNVLKAEQATAKLIGQGYAVITPHLLTANMQGLYEDRVYLDICLELLRRCDTIYMLKEWQNSAGSREEFAEATSMGLKVIFEE